MKLWRVCKLQIRKTIKGEFEARQSSLKFIAGGFIAGTIFGTCAFVAFMTYVPFGAGVQQDAIEREYRRHPRAPNQLSPMTIRFRHLVAGASTVDVRPYLSSDLDTEALSKSPFVTLQGASVHKFIANLALDEVPGRTYFGGLFTDTALYAMRFYRPHHATLTFIYCHDGETLVSDDKLWWAGLPLTQASQDYLKGLLTYTKGRDFNNPQVSMISDAQHERWVALSHNTASTKIK